MKAIGIDLGTTNSVISCYRKGASNVIKIEGEEIIPSVAYIDKQGNIMLGKSAKKRILIDSAQTLSSTKRNIGDKSWTKEINGNDFTPIDAAREILSYLKREAEKTLGSSIQQAVITIPAYFNDAQRNDTMIAAKQAGFQVLRLLPEPTAAAVSHGFEKEKDQSILVIDLGGGTFDVSILKITNNNFEVKAVDGNSQLGGDDFDNAIADFIHTWIEENLGQSLRDDPRVKQRLKEEAERAKIELSSAMTTQILIPNLAPDINVDIDFSRTQYKALIQEYLEQIVNKTNSVLSDAQLDIDDINRVVLVGGSCKHPIIKDLIRAHFKEPFVAGNMDTCVAQGAALVCASLLAPTPEIKEELGKPVDISLQDVLAHSLGVEMISSILKVPVIVHILKRNTNYPNMAGVFGVAKPKQKEVRLRVWRGEVTNQPEANTFLGELNMIISKENLGDNENLILSIFDLDANGIITFTGVEIPSTPSIVNSLEMQAAFAESDRDSPTKGVITYATIKRLLDKQNFKSNEIIIKTNGTL